MSVTILNSVKSQQILKDTIYFSVDQHKLFTSELEKLHSTFRNLNDVNIVSIFLSGHSDSSGNKSYNHTLSKKRVHSVAKFFIKKNINHQLIIKSSHSSSIPVAPNNSKVNKSKNRRVEITITFQNPSFNNETLIKQPNTQIRQDTTIYGPKGTEITMKKNTFSPYKIEQIDFDFTEVFSKTDIITHDKPTLDINGNCLVTGGMIFTNAKVDGQFLSPNSEMTVRIPTEKIDTNMKIYSIQVVDSDTLWKETDLNLNFDTIKKFYEFNMSKMPNINIDKRLPINQISDFANDIINAPKNFIQLFKEKGLVVKSKKINFTKTYLFNDSLFSVVRGGHINKKKARYTPFYFNKNSLVVSISYRNGVIFLASNQLKDIKYKRFLNKFILKKNEYELVYSKLELADKLNILFRDEKK